MPESHYLPAYTQINGRKQKAACGAWVTARQHADQPTCADCLAYVLSERETAHLTADDVFGPAPVCESHRLAEPVDITGGHERRGRR